MAESETVSQFAVEGVSFYVLWKPGLCLLRTIESPGGEDERHYTVADLFRDGYNGSPDYTLEREAAIAMAPDIAQRLITEQRQQELKHLPQLYSSPQMQEAYPDYILWEDNSRGTPIPVIWASHNAGLYCRPGDQWLVTGFANSREEANEKATAFIRDWNASEAGGASPRNRSWLILLLLVGAVAMGYWLT